MNSRERVTRAINRTGPDRVPMMDALWEDTLTRWYGVGLPQEAVGDNFFGEEAAGGLADYFGFDIETLAIDASPRLPQKLISDDGEYLVYQDRFGYSVKKSKGKSRTMHFFDHVTTERAAWEQLKGRFVLDPEDTARIDRASYFMHMDPYPTWAAARQIYAQVRKKERYLLVSGYGPWEATWRHRGYTPLLIDLATDPEFVGEMATTYVDLLIAILQKCLDEGIRQDGFFMVEDLAYTRAMLMSPRVWRQIFKPLVARLGAFLRANGLTFWMHCCGNAEPIFGDLIECGLQVIQPLEAKSGLDVRELREKYGDELTFWGNIDVINMANGTDDEIEAEIRDKLAPFVASGGGYIYHSDHSVPPEVSYPRYRRVLELVRKYGRSG